MNSSATFHPGPVRPAPEPRPGYRRFQSIWVAALLVAGVSIGGAMAAAPEPAVSKEYKIKAAFLYNFTKFVQWPAGKFKDANAPIVIGVIGSNPFGIELESIVHERAVNGRNLTIVALPTGNVPSTVHVVFVADGEEKLLEKYGDALSGHGVLTVGESERFAAQGGMVNFNMAEEKVRFEINMAAVERGGLKISSQMQKLASAVRRKP